MAKKVIGLLAHVDSGKTTLAEALFYKTGEIKTFGRVDKKDSTFDNNKLERERGITVYAKEGVISTTENEFYIIDTPGHIDFSPEMERVLWALDIAVLIVSVNQLITSYTKTIWSLLEHFKIPTVVFVNKMDISQVPEEEIVKQLHDKLSGDIVSYSNKEEFFEHIALSKEKYLKKYLDTGGLGKEEVSYGVNTRAVFPLVFGSALKIEGIKEIIEIFDEITTNKQPKETFGGKIIKIKNIDNKRATIVKITGGKIKVKDTIDVINADNELVKEKVNDILVFKEGKYQQVDEGKEGMVCALIGLKETASGNGLGFEHNSDKKTLIPTMEYRLTYPKELNHIVLLPKLKELTQEDPTLQVKYLPYTDEIKISVMGKVHMEILKEIIKSRFDIDCDFEDGEIIYKETITKKVEGVGHFEPIGHYSEVHLLLEPLKRGEGVKIQAKVSADILGKNWQQAVLSTLENVDIPGVVTGSSLTDISITLVTGKSHKKHTEGGDFRNATIRALRQGLAMAESIVLEPIYSFTLSAPFDCIGRAMTDLTKFKGVYSQPEIEGDEAIIRGEVPLRSIMNYNMELLEYTRGQGRLSLSFNRYDNCEDEEAINNIKYSGIDDVNFPCDSIFCSHGKAFSVPYDQVYDYMHLPLTYNDGRIINNNIESVKTQTKKEYSNDELMEIFYKTYGKKERILPSSFKRKILGDTRVYKGALKKKLGNIVLLDGYNMIFGIEVLKDLSKNDLTSARLKLVDMVKDFQGLDGSKCILVFDAYKVLGGKEIVEKEDNIYIVYTKEAETADEYIEKTVKLKSKDYNITVVTSDSLEQIIIFGAGANRMSTREWAALYVREKQALVKDYRENNDNSKVYALDNISDEVREKIKRIGDEV